MTVVGRRCKIWNVLSNTCKSGTSTLGICPLWGSFGSSLDVVARFEMQAADLECGLLLCVPTSLKESAYPEISYFCALYKLLLG